MDQSRRVRILALGSPHGDDQVAWAVAERLRADPELRDSVFILASPWDMAPYLDEGYAIIVLDACRSGAPPGTIHRLEERDLAAIQITSRATHQVSVAEVFQLARYLGRKVSRLVLFAVAAPVCEPGTEMSESARRAVSQLEVQVRRELSQVAPAARGRL